MTGVFVPPGKQQFFLPNSSAPLVGGQVFMYIPNSGTPKATWQDQAETIANTNPITLDANGECTIWGEGLFRQVLFDANGNQLWDQITGFSGSGGGGVTFATPAQVAALSAHNIAIDPFSLGASGVLGGGGGSGYGMHLPLATLGTLSLDGSTVGSNDTIIAAAEASGATLHYATPYGIIRTNLNNTQLTKGYTGDAGFITGPGAGDGAYRPPNYAYMAVKPSTWPVQGDGGFWRGDQRFTDNGEWKIIGPNVRTYDITSRYFESNTIPHPAWLDTFSGGSGIDAYLTSGATAGASVITINAAATAAWIGKTAAFSLTADGSVAESHTVSNVSGSTIDISPAVLSNTYTWNPGGGLTPCIFFGHRTSASLRYTKHRHNAAGDNYIDVARNNNNYVPLASQYHFAMTATTGQYGGDVTFGGADGTYGQFFESQLQAGAFDVTGIGFVGSFVRNNDTALTGGKFWAGTWYQSGGTRPADAGFVLLGLWRNGLDTVFATMEETSRLTGNAATTSTFNVASTNGAHPNDPFVIGSETLTIQNVVSATQLTTTGACAGSYTTGQFVQYPKGGAVLNMAKGQRHVWNSSLTSNGRSGDPLGVYPTFYGNVQGDLITESGNDGSSDYLSMRFARGTTAAQPDTSRLRLRPTGVNIFGTAHTFAGSVSIAAGLGTPDVNLPAGGRFTLGPTAWLVFQSGHIQGTIDGVTFVNIV